MRDGRTRKHNRDARTLGIKEFLESNEARIVVVAGPALGQSFTVDRDRVTLGRGPGVDLVFVDPEMSRQHAVIEYTSEGFRIRDLGSTNGIFLNGRQVQVGDVKHGDRFEIGSQAFRFVIEEREPTPNTYELSTEP